MTALFDRTRSLTPDSSGPIAPERFAALAAEVAQAALREGLVKVESGRCVPYPMLPSLVQLTENAEAHLGRHVPEVVSAWRTLVQAHRTDQQVRDFLAVPPVLRQWVDAAPAADYRVDFCRFDLVGGEVETARVVEFNANCPGGVLFTSLYRAKWRAIPEISEVLDDWGSSHTLLDDRLWFPRFVCPGPADADGSQYAGQIGIFHKPGGNVLELGKMAALLAEAGYRSMQVDPGADDWLDQSVWAGYLKYGVQAALADIGHWEAFLERLVTGKLRIANPLPGRWIGDNKLCLAALSDPRFAGLFTAAQRRAIDLLIPCSRKVGDGVSPRELLAERPGWVIKGPYDTRGNSVYVGSEQDPVKWHQIVRHAAAEGWLAQEAVPPSRRTWRGVPGYQDLSVVLLGGRWAGYTSRLSENLRVNVAQGGGRQVVFGHRGTWWGPGEAGPASAEGKP